MSVPPGTCPRCAAPAAAGQEYCLSCGARLPGPGRVGAATAARPVRGRVLGLAAVALLGAGLAIGLTREADATTEVVTATGGSATVPQPAQTGEALTPWPAGRDAWTIVLVSVPKEDGRDKALAVAEAARQRGLEPAGVLDSSRFPSLRPGYWMAYEGIFDSEAEANSALRRGRSVARTARVERVAS
ncbi:MAG: hypothetical protein ACRC50_10420 [Gaiella sp.]